MNGTTHRVKLSCQTVAKDNGLESRLGLTAIHRGSVGADRCGWQVVNLDLCGCILDFLDFLDFLDDLGFLGFLAIFGFKNDSFSL